jgi:mannosyltransferase OCH1-like enzyme
MISPAAGAAKADIWRYAVLYTYGGAYIDDDSDMKVPLDRFIEPLDTMIVTKERNQFNADTCYIPRYHLSNLHTFRNETARRMNIFSGHILPNWAMISAPRHAFLKRSMENIVEIIRYEYFQESVLRHLKGAYRWSAIMCSTGPSMMTASSREIVIENPIGLNYKVAGMDFKDYGGKFKAVSVKVRDDPNHYMNMHKKKHIHLLASYLPERPITTDILLSWENEAVQSQNGKEIFVIQQGKKRGIPNFDTFLALNLSMVEVRVISDSRMDQIPLGEPMPNLST